MTCAKMEKLTQMAKKNSLFHDHNIEMEELSLVLKQVLFIFFIIKFIFIIKIIF